MATKKRSTRKKAARKSGKKTARKKAAKKKAAKKKPARKKVAKKKATRKKPARKKVSKKKASKKKKKSTKKKAKKKTTKKKPARKKASGKKAKSKKKPAKAKSRKKAAKKVAKKRAVKKKAASKKKAKKAIRKVAARRPVARPKPRKRRGDEDDGLIHGVEPYARRAGEDYMNEEQLEHFREILLSWKRELMEEVDRTVHHMQDEASNFPDPNDRATQESEFGLELRTRDRERKLIKKIDSAIERIDDGSYGFCEETGEEIGLKRLEARPVATLSVEAQERRELAERQYRDRDDQYR